MASNKSMAYQPKAQAGRAGLLEACIAKAESLLQVIGTETEILRGFKGEELLSILPRKERLSIELRDAVLALKETIGVDKENGDDSRFGFLKYCLEEISRINESNRVFIDGSLAYYQDLLDCIRPSGYGPEGDEAARRSSVSYKGLVFRKEA